jgi:undecaprenyl-diphosphatase
MEPMSLPSAAVPVLRGGPLARSLHRDPPATPSAFFARRPRLLAAIGATFLFLAVSATVDRGALLLTWDEPIQKAVESRRGDEWNSLFFAASRLGSTVFVLALGALLALIAWRRCRAVSIAVVVATLVRPGIEWFIKALVERGRPDFGRMVTGTGYSFPSGHVMAAVALWGLLPVIVGLYTNSRKVWWASVAVAGTIISLIAASRVYLGVHWFSDVVGGLLFGSFFLLGVDWVLRNTHRHVRCGDCLTDDGVATPPSA